MIAVAYGRAEPPRAGHKVHLLPVVGSYLSVRVDTVVGGFEDFSLPVPRPEQKFQNLIDAQGSSVTWPCAWVQYLDEVIYISYLSSNYFKNMLVFVSNCCLFLTRICKRGR